MGAVLVDEDGDPVVDNFFIFPAHGAAARLFYACENRWHFNDYSGQRKNLDWPAVESVARGMGIDWQTPELQTQLATIEQGALGALIECPLLDELKITQVECERHG